MRTRAAGVALAPWHWSAPRSLAPAQERQVFRGVDGRDPRPFGADVGPRTRAVAAVLIERKCGVRPGVASVGPASPGFRPDRFPGQCGSNRAPSTRWRHGGIPVDVHPVLPAGSDGVATISVFPLDRGDDVLGRHT